MTKEERKKQAKELLDQVRAFRFEITERDGMGMPDRLFDEEIITYRQALRDVHENSPDMDLDDKGKLIFQPRDIVAEKIYNSVSHDHEKYDMTIDSVFDID